MTKRQVKDDVAAIIEDEVAAIEADRDAPITDSSKISRGHARSKTLQVRLNPDELAELERRAASRGLPTSTVAREAIIRLIRPEVARTAAASRLVDEFARYVATIGAVDIAFPTAPGSRSSRGSATQPDDDEPSPPELHPQELGSGTTWEKVVKAMDEMPNISGIPELSKFDDADLTYAVVSDSTTGRSILSVRAPGPQRVSSTQVFESQAAAQRAVAALRKTKDEIRASAVAAHLTGRLLDDPNMLKKVARAMHKHDLEGPSQLFEFDDADLTYELFTDLQGKFRFHVILPIADITIAWSENSFESKQDAERAVAALRKAVQEIRASAPLDPDP